MIGKGSSDPRTARKTLTFDASGGASANLFQITGSVEIKKLFGHVSTILNADVGASYFDLFPTGGAAIEITDNAGVDISSAPVGSLVYKDDVATAVAKLQSSALGFINEKAGALPPMVSFLLGQKLTIDTFIRLTYAGVGTDGAIVFHIEWEPISNDGLIVAV